MTKQNFLQSLRNVFHKARVEDIDSIIDVYEEHFTAGHEKGLSDEEIIHSLGTPEEIYASYVDAGIITDSTGDDAEGNRKINMQALYTRLDEYKEKILPQLPGLARGASRTLLVLGAALSYIVGVLIFIVTPAAVYLLGLGAQPFENLTAFPVLSPITLAAVFGTGLFSGLCCIFIGNALRDVKRVYFKA